MRRPGLTRLVLSTILVVLIAWRLTSALRGTGRGSQGADRPAGSAHEQGPPEMAGAAPRVGTTPATEDAEPSPSWAITGRVLDPGGTPRPGARVRARTRRGQVRAELPSARTDAAGTFRLDLATLARWPRLVRATAYLTVFAEAEGHRPSGEEEVYLSEQPPGTPLEVDLQVRAGGTVRGRVVDAAGTPLPGASAGLHELGQDWLRHGGAYTEPDGRYVRPTSRPGPHVVEAAWGGVTARTAPFDVAGGAEVIAPDVVMPVTAGFIEGVVLRPDGAPASGLEIRLHEEEPRGYDFGTIVAVSDEAGHFRFAAPAGATWRVGTDTRFPRDEIECKAGGPPIRLTIPPCRLVVRVVTEDGTPLPGTEVSYLAWRTTERGARDALLAGASTREEAEAGAWVWEDGETETAEGTETSYVEADSAWWITARVPGGLPTEATLDIGPDDTEAEITLTVREHLPSGSLALTCVRPDGSSVEAWTGEVETLAGSLLAELRPEPTGAPLEVPAGRVRLRVKPGAERAWSDGALPADSFLLPVERTVEIEAGGRQSLRLAMKAGGRFRVSVAPDGRSRPRYGPADIRIRPRDGSEETIRGVSDWISVEGDPPQPGNGWVPGTTAVSAEPLPPGDYVLRVHHHALKPYEAPLRIEARETTHVVLAWDD